MPDGFDIVGDIHGHANELHRLLSSLGYSEMDGSYQHPERTVLFVGDFVDRGPDQKEVLRVAQGMCEAGRARAVMGNHEFNALGWATPDGAGGHLRSHEHDHREQHVAFLDQLREGSALYHDTLSWFWSLPVAINLGGLRVVHACWHEPSLRVLQRESLDSAGRFTQAGFAMANQRNSPAFKAAEVVLKGPEVRLPGDMTFKDVHDRTRSEARLRWWDKDATTYRTATLGVEGREDELPDRPIPTNFQYADTVPVAFGHYWLEGQPRICGPYATCLDFSVARKGYLAAYRWSGEPSFKAENLVSVACG